MMTRRRFWHGLRTWAALMGLTMLLGVLGFSLAGLPGAFTALGLGAAYVLLRPRGSPSHFLTRRGAQVVPEHYELAELVADLAGRAGLPRPPRVFHLSDPTPNAMALGDRDDSAVAVTSGLLQVLDRHQLAAVLAHEVSHIAHDDLRLLAVAYSFTRMTTWMARLGLLLALINLPLLFLSGGVPWITVLLLVLAPAVGSLLQLHLARTRELDADLGAVRLTGDPLTLVSALEQLERRRAASTWHRVLGGGHGLPESWLSTHPHAALRVRHILRLAAVRTAA